MADSPNLRLPTGMRDFPPRAASARRRIAETLLATFEGWGYARVITPAFEYEEVLALGLGPKGRAAVIRFVEPASGQVVALRPDITPQIARLIATRFHDEPGAVRLCYEGTVTRLEPGGRGQRELIQAGVELCGVPGPQGDAEVMAVAAAALGAAGLDEVTLDVGHLGLAREVMDALELPEAAVDEARARIAKRDGAGLREVLRQARGPRPVVAFAELLPDLAGGPEVLGRAARQAPTAGVRRALADLAAIVREIEAQGLAARLRVDLGEVRGFDYYTGVRFQGFVAGAPDAVLRGGRYDGLLARYGRPSPAVGFAVDVEAAAGALETGAGRMPRDAARGVLLTGDPRAAARLARQLRGRGRRVAVDVAGMSPEGARAYAERWGFAEVRAVGARGGARSPAVTRTRPKSKRRT